MKRLVTEVLTTKWGVKLWRVKEQTHRGNEFGPIGHDAAFRAGNGHILTSSARPASSSCLTQTYLRGSDKRTDELINLVDSEEWLCSHRQAVKEYNAFFSDKPAEPEDGSDVETIE